MDNAIVIQLAPMRDLTEEELDKFEQNTINRSLWKRILTKIALVFNYDYCPNCNKITKWHRWDFIWQEMNCIKCGLAWRQILNEDVKLGWIGDKCVGATPIIRVEPIRVEPIEYAPHKAGYYWAGTFDKKDNIWGMPRRIVEVCCDEDGLFYTQSGSENFIDLKDAPFNYWCGPISAPETEK